MRWLGGKAQQVWGRKDAVRAPALGTVVLEAPFMSDPS